MWREGSREGLRAAKTLEMLETAVRVGELGSHRCPYLGRERQERLAQQETGTEMDTLGAKGMGKGAECCNLGRRQERMRALCVVVFISRCLSHGLRHSVSMCFDGLIPALKP